MSGTDFVIGFDIKLDFFAREGTHSAAKRAVRLFSRELGGRQT